MMGLPFLSTSDASLLHAGEYHRRRTILRAIAFVASLLNWYIPLLLAIHRLGLA